MLKLVGDDLEEEREQLDALAQVRQVVVVERQNLSGTPTWSAGITTRSRM